MIRHGVAIVILIFLTTFCYAATLSSSSNAV